MNPNSAVSMGASAPATFAVVLVALLLTAATSRAAAPPAPSRPAGGPDVAAASQQGATIRVAAASSPQPASGRPAPLAVLYTAAAAQPALGLPAEDAPQPMTEEPAPQPAPTVPPEAGQPPAGGTPEAPQAETPQKITVAFGESYKLPIPAGIGRLKSWIVGRESIVLVTPIALPGTERGVPSFLLLAGKRMGQSELSLVGEERTRSYSIQIVPSISHLEAMLLRQFPNANVRITQAAENILIAEGVVDSPAEVEPILALLKNFVPHGSVINGLRIVGPMQVQLEVVFARVDRTRLRQLGFNFTGSEKPWYYGSQAGSLILSPNIAPAAGSTFPGIGGASTAPMTGNSSLFLGFTRSASSFSAYLEALETQGVAKVMARPTLVTLSGRPAEFLDGGEQPYEVISNLGTANVTFKKFGTRLNFLPIVMGDGKIRLELRPEVSRIDESTPVGELPRLVQQAFYATVEMESGQTLVLAGMYQTSADAEVQKVPVLGSLPLVGAAFRRVRHVARDEELTVLVTPRVVHPLDPHQLPPQLPGEETRNPSDCELYLHGLPEVEACPAAAPASFRGPLADQSWSAPVQYPSWEPPVNPPPASEAPATDPRPQARPSSDPVPAPTGSP